MVIESNLPPGVHPGLTSEQYHAWKLDKASLINGPISCSMLKAFAVSPFAWRYGKEKEVTAAMRAGSLFDYALTEPESLDSRCLVSPYENFKKAEAREWRDSALACGALIVSELDLEHAKRAASKVRHHDESGPILDDCDFQVGVVGKVGEIPAKCLIDILPREDSWDETIWDYKTTSGLDDESIRRTIGQFKYHWQAGLYRTLWNKVSTDRYCESFGFIFQDRDTLEIRVVKLDDDALSLGTRSVGKALKEFVRCAHQGIVSKYAVGVSDLAPLPYQSMSEEEWLES